MKLKDVLNPYTKFGLDKYLYKYTWGLYKYLYKYPCLYKYPWGVMAKFSYSQDIKKTLRPYLKSQTPRYNKV